MKFDTRTIFVSLDCFGFFATFVSQQPHKLPFYQNLKSFYFKREHHNYSKYAIYGGRVKKSSQQWLIITDSLSHSKINIKSVTPIKIDYSISEPLKTVKTWLNLSFISLAPFNDYDHPVCQHFCLWHNLIFEQLITRKCRWKWIWVQGKRS